MKILSSLANKINTSENNVLSVLINAPNKYKVYTIPKRTHGRRTIAHPCKELKELQRAFIELQNFPVHANAMAYKKNYSIKDNALVHSKQQYLLKIDLSNFFNSITPTIFWEAWKNKWPLPSIIDVKLMENLLFWNRYADVKNDLVLSVGAPSSPAISNFCLYTFDEIMLRYCSEKSIFYSRYADDMTFSTNVKDALFSVPSFVAEKLKDCFSLKIFINNQKTVFSSKAHNRHVTGITITNDQTLSLGRNRKRYIKHLVHQYKLRKLNEDDIKHLKGLLAFANHIESRFIESLKNKYSVNLMQEIIQG